MKPGDLVIKKTGYRFEGIVLAVFPNLRGHIRVAVELVNKCNGLPGNGDGMIHIFDIDQLESIYD